MNKKVVVSLAALAMLLAFAYAVYLFKTQEIKKAVAVTQELPEALVRDYSVTLGSPNAKVVLVEFFDPACETCRAFYDFVKKIMAQNEGKIRLVLRYAPFHQGADYFVKILEAARRQNLFWETLEVMYKTQGAWASHHNPQPQLIWGFLEETPLDLEKVKTDMESAEILEILKQDQQDARALGVDKTPGFFVNGKPLVQFGYGTLRSLISGEIEAHYP